MNRSGRRQRRFHPQTESCEGRLLLSAGVHVAGRRVLALPGAESHPIRPNTPVLPFGSPAAAATFIDPAALVVQGDRITLGSKDYVAPFALLDASSGSIRIGQNSAVLDNAQIVANPAGAAGSPDVTIGERTVVSFGARVLGPSQVGGFGTSNRPTLVGSNAVVDSATIEPGAIVGAGAKVTGVTVPSGVRVLPNAVVSTQAEASDPRLGKVVPTTAADLTAIDAQVANSSALAAGYTTLYQGQSNTGVSGAPEATTSTPNLFNGNLSTVRGAGQEPGSPAVSFEPSRRGPTFPGPHGRSFQGNFSEFPARITGGVAFNQSARKVAQRVGKHVSIRGDEGQPIVIGSIARLDQRVTIHAPRGGTLTIGRDFRAGAGAVVLGGVGSTIGDGVTVGNSAVVEGSRLGSGVVIGEGAYVSGTTLPPGASVPAGAVLINGERR